MECSAAPDPATKPGPVPSRPPSPVSLPVLALAFLLGDLGLQSLPELPPTWVLWSGLALSPTLLCIRSLRWLSALGIGFFWAAILAQWNLAARLDPALEGRDLLVRGIIASIPESQSRGIRFDLIPNSMLSGEEPRSPPSKIRLSCYQNCPELRVGDLWQFQVRLKRPHGFLNPGGFDYEGWLWQQGIGATGYVTDTPELNRRLETSPWSRPVDRLRQLIHDRILAQLGSGNQAGLALSLSIGDRSLIDQDLWRDLTRTGTNHLVAISGLHVTMLAGLFLFLGRWLWSRSERLCLRLPAQHAGALIGMLAGLGYTAIAGWSVPTQRTLLMLLVGLGSLLVRRNTTPMNTLALALLVILLYDPLAALSAGFWLSFGAVAAILIVNSGRLGRSSWTGHWLRTQWAVSVGLLPLLLFLFRQFSLISPLANLWAVPWFGLILVPLLLFVVTLLVLLPEWGKPLLDWLGYPLDWTLTGLHWLADWPWAIWQQPEPPLWVWPSALLGSLVLLLPRGTPGRWTSLLLLAPALLIGPQGPVPGEFRLTILDVGQGNANVVQTQGHSLVFDAGPRYSAGLDTGASVLVPFLRSQGIARVDTLVLSNADADHAGGAEALIAAVEVGDIYSGTPAQLSLPGARSCVSGMSWEWDGVKFQFLHPEAGHPWRGNNASCVLRLSNPTASVLLTADIEAAAETELVRRWGAVLASDILLVPHHGSGTSSTRALVSQVRPRFALFSLGYRNRYGFPHPRVVQAWRDGGARVLTTSGSGAIRFNVSAKGSLKEPMRERVTRHRFWRQAAEGLE